MNLFRNILTAIWCAVIIGTNLFGLILIARVYGLDVLQVPAMLLPAVKMAVLTGFGLLALISTKYLWAVLAVAATAMLAGFAHEVLAQRTWQPSNLLTGLATIVPTYLLARWNTAARKSDFNPVKEF